MTTLESILRALRGAGDQGVSGTQVSSALGISRTAIWSHIQELRQLGYDIEATSHRGYRLLSVPDSLLGEDLMSQLPQERLIGRSITIYRETASTNLLVDQRAMHGESEGWVVFAESQTRGRGRLGRSWVSPAGKGLWFSVLLRPPLRPPEMTQLTVISATALSRAIRQVTGLQPEIKWPNDILIQGKKVAGVLTEMSAETDRVSHAALGIGINVNLEASDFPSELQPVATSLQIEKGEPIHRSTLAVALLKALDEDYARICQGSFQEVAREWADQCITLGKRVRIHQLDHSYLGVAESIDPEGALMIRTEHGELERVTGGDVTLEKEP